MNANRQSRIEDEPLAALLNQATELLRIHPGQTFLWVADEHPLPSSQLAMLANENMHFISNRFDQVQLAQQQGLNSFFSDMDFDLLPTSSFDGVFFRIAKERKLSHRVINEAFRVLTPTGTLWISGYKNQGIKTYIDHTKRTFNTRADVERGDRQRMLAKIEAVQPKIGVSLDDNDYPNLRQHTIANTTFWTKPGLYGWDKIDQGSALLVEWLHATPERIQHKTVLDLGCGYGYLSLFCAHMNAESIVATDNCAAAIAACKKNLAAVNTPTTVIADDAATSITTKFDVIVCNPPFHQGFTTTPKLHSTFLKAISARLSPQGKAYLVINQFLSLQKEATKVGLQLQEQKTELGFTLLEASFR